MRPEPLETPVQYVKGVGPRLAVFLGRLGIQTVEDLLYHLPSRYLDRRRIDSIGRLTVGRNRCVVGSVESAHVIRLGSKGRMAYKAILSDGTGKIGCLWFHLNYLYFKERFVRGRSFLVAGDVSEYRHELQFVHPTTDLLEGGLEDIEELGTIVPVYPLTAGLWQKTLHRIMKNAWQRYAKDLVDPVPMDLAKELDLEGLTPSLEALHWPPPEADVDRFNRGDSEAHERLIFQELFVLQVGLALKRLAITREITPPFAERQGRVQEMIRGLPFRLTGAQERVFAEILADFKSGHPMNRLLQGDVGCGKTLVALMAALVAVANGAQAAFMAPTEILVLQHFETIQRYLGRLPVRVACLTSGTPAAQKREWIQAMARGEVDIVVGTHALLEPDVRFRSLRFIIIDEQHRFGVMQRARLKSKGVRPVSICPHVLVMTATPIPRTLAMTLYGDLDISVIDEMPAGRVPITTRLFPSARRGELYGFLDHQLTRRHQVFVVYPLVEESEKVDLRDATRMTAEFKRAFPERNIALVHGRMKSEEKEIVMRRFKEKEVDVLVATTVVEVGIDVPNATVMVVEHADRFGLAQLHQLRGRIGRGTEPSFCLLVANEDSSALAQQRLGVMVETLDGFKIAEKDLEIRGPGEVMGTRQAGLPDLKLANLGRDTKILAKAREAAQRTVASDPGLAQTQHLALRAMLRRQWASRLDLANIA